MLTDEIIHYDESNHIAVYHKGRYYKVDVYRKGKLLNSVEIQCQLEWIINSDEVASHAESFLASLTSWNRAKWAEVRDNHFSGGINKISLGIIESAAFILTLGDDDLDMELMDLSADRQKLHNYSRLGMHGKIYDIWFDKSFGFNVGTNGRVG